MRKIWCLLILFGANVSGQKLADGQVVVRNLDVVRGENALFVSMDLDVSALDIATNRELLFVPVLKGDRDSVQLPFVIVAGTVISIICAILPCRMGICWNAPDRQK